MIATSASTDVLRHGWLDAAATLAPDIPEIADLLGARLNDAIASGQLSEDDLMSTIAEVEATASRVGSTSGSLLARRLRRTVYEYLLALDANTAVDAQQAALVEAEAATTEALPPPTEAPLPAPAQVAPTTPAVPVTSAPPPGPGDIADAAAVYAEFDETEPADGEDPDAAEGRRRRFGFRRRPGGPDQRRADDGDVDDDLAWLQQLPSLSAGAPPPAPPQQIPTPDEDDAPVATSHLFEPVVMDEPALPEASTPSSMDEDPTSVDASGDAVVGIHVEPEQVEDAGEREDATPAQPAGTTPIFDLQDYSSPAAAGHHGAADVTDVEAPDADSPDDVRFVAPRAGFHIVEDTDPGHVPDPSESAVGAMVFRSSADARGADAHEENPSEPVVADRPAAIAQPAQPASIRVPDPAVDDMLDPASWRVRHPTAEARRSAAARGDVGVDPATEAADPFESDSRLFELRRKIQDRLRRKRCDEAAALLQLLAQETGGRAVAELAMDAGDRCRGLGKNNAALNCYLAASRADPVFELPLSRLADICIDDQDIDLAVSYLERIARLHRMRGDEKAALRVYRRVVTVAPYRDDILAMLMNARNNGGIDV